MIKTIIESMKLIFKKIELSKINYLNHKFKKYIIGYEEKGDKIKIINSTGDSKFVENNIPNKVKIMDIIKDHEIEIKNKLNYYENKKDDYKIIILSSGLFLLVLGALFIFSFFVGSYILLLLTLISFSISLVLFGMNTYKIVIFREEIKRLKYIKNNKNIYNENELKDIILDGFTYVKKYFYSFILKIITLVDNIKVKFN